MVRDIQLRLRANLSFFFASKNHGHRERIVVKAIEAETEDEIWLQQRAREHHTDWPWRRSNLLNVSDGNTTTIIQTFTI